MLNEIKLEKQGLHSAEQGSMYLCCTYVVYIFFAKLINGNIFAPLKTQVNYNNDQLQIIKKIRPKTHCFYDKMDFLTTQIPLKTQIQS